jgi:3-oxocholest-4-en-26-oyl-CoA dehydrogenase alpha subunit
MDFEVRYTEEQERFRNEVSAWLDENVPALLLKGTATVMHATAEEYQAQRDFGRALGAKGWLYPSGPREYGGGGLDADASLVIMEEMGKRGLGLPPYYDAGGVLGGMAILVWGTEEQKRRYLPPIYQGEVRGWQLLSEPSAGSDLAGVQTTAVREGDEYVINGQKIYIGSENGADAYWTLARTGDPKDRHRNLSWFWIGGEHEGISHQPMRLIGSSEKNTVFLDNVRVPERALVGGENNGWKVATTHLELEHGFRADMILNQAGQRTFQELLEHCQQTTLDGRRLIDDPVVREAVAEAYARFEIQRVWGLRNYWLAGQRTQTYEGAQAYFFDKVTGMLMTRLISDAAGPSAMVWNGPAPAAGGALARTAAIAIGASHGGGTIDIQRVVMSRRLGIGRPDAESGAALA